MGSKTLTMPEDAIVNLLKSLPDDVLIDVFWKTVVESDTTALSKDEKEDIEAAKTDVKKGQTVRWEDIK